MAHNSDATAEQRERISARDLSEGDRCFMGVNAHGTATDLPGVEYDRDVYQAGVAGTVVEALSETEKGMLADGITPMADLAVETDDGVVYRWNVDNGYVIGPNRHDDGPDRTDVGKIGGFYSD